MNQKTAKLLRKFVNKTVQPKTKAEGKKVLRRVKRTYLSQTDVERVKIKNDMRESFKAVSL